MNERRTEVEKLTDVLIKKGHKISRAKRVKSLLEKQKGLIKKKQSLTDFDEPVLDLHRRDGTIETYEKATAGEFVFDHSTGKPRFITLRPSDQETRDYAGRKVRWYSAHEDRPYAGWDNPIVDSESVMLGYEKTKATDLKYQTKIEELKRKGKMTWVWIIVGIAVAFMIGAFAWGTWIEPARTAKQAALIAANVTKVQNIAPSVGAILFYLKSGSKL